MLFLLPLATSAKPPRSRMSLRKAPSIQLQDCEYELSRTEPRIQFLKKKLGPWIKEFRDIEAHHAANPEKAERARFLRYDVGRRMVKQSLMLAAHVADEVILYRPFNHKMLEYLSDRRVRPKLMWPLKSADRGLAAGFVPYDVRLSKGGASMSPEEAAVHQHETDRLIEEGLVKKIPLVSREGTAVVRHGEQVWTKQIHREDQILFILADSSGRRLISDVDLFDVGRREPPGLAEWDGSLGWVNAADRQSLELINYTFRKLHPGMNSPDLVPHGPEMRKPEGEYRIDFPLHALIPGQIKVPIAEGPPEDRYLHLRQFIKSFLERGYHFSPQLLRELEISPTSH